MGEAVVSSEEMGLIDVEKESSVVKWERFLPKMSLRVLLVEADDSTRHIISALLRKCSYKVASVADGLKAWEILKARPHEIDLILTEVDLPSISGFALLTLIMEHEICKSIPVIMMSSHDSVSTVYNCMMRGAADYLVKPIRRNELRNLWQHVWRRQSQVSSGGNYLQIESKAEQKVEGTSENNAVCKDCSSYTGSVQRNMESADKGSEAGGTTSLDLQNIEPESEGKDGNVASEASDNNDELVNSGREAIDLIAVFNNHQNCSYKNTASIASNFDFESCPQLDLSLKRSHPGTGFEFENHGTEKRHMIKHSDASAFSRYTNKPQKQLLPTQTSDRSQENESEVPDSSTQQRVFAVPISVREVKFNNICSNNGSKLPSAFCTQSVPLPNLSPSSVNHKEPVFQVNSEQLFDHRHLSVKNCTINNVEQGLEFLEECRQINNGHTDHSGSSSFYKGATSHFHSAGYGSISVGADQVAAARNAGENKNVEGLCGTSNRSLLREAALNKFRLKRKDRCFEKKVRYESRKKLAEQRPRVKGQFVRHVQSDVTPTESESNQGNSLNC